MGTVLIMVSWLSRTLMEVPMSKSPKPLKPEGFGEHLVSGGVWSVARPRGLGPCPRGLWGREAESFLLYLQRE